MICLVIGAYVEPLYSGNGLRSSRVAHDSSVPSELMLGGDIETDR